MNQVDETLDKALSGERLSEEDALLLMEANGDSLMAIGNAANVMRERMVGDIATYIINRNINFTNICTGSCKFCAFRRDFKDEDAYFLDVRKVLEKGKEAKKIGATELCIQGGLHPEIDIDYFVSVVRTLKERMDLHIHAFSPMEIYYVSQKNGMNIRKTIKTLKDSGLDSIPGTAAEILVDSVRKKICPEKLSSAEWVNIIREAHRQGISTTATMLYGHVESKEDQVKHLSIIRDIQDETGGFTEFIPLSFVHFNAPLFLSGEAGGNANGLDDLRLFAVSRLFLDNFKNIQASWVKLGRKLSQIMLCYGANDLGGTLVEENISRSAGIDTEMITKEELEMMIVHAGRVPMQRDTLYTHQ